VVLSYLAIAALAMQLVRSVDQSVEWRELRHFSHSFPAAQHEYPVISWHLKMLFSAPSLPLIDLVCIAHMGKEEERERKNRKSLRYRCFLLSLLLPLFPSRISHLHHDKIARICGPLVCQRRSSE
jgi:hypothetical protein